MCPQTPRLSPEYSHKAGLQTVITGMPLQIRSVTRSGHAGPVTLGRITRGPPCWTRPHGRVTSSQVFVRCRICRRVSLPVVLSPLDQQPRRRLRAKGGVFAFAPTTLRRLLRGVSHAREASLLLAVTLMWSNAEDRRYGLFRHCFNFLRGIFTCILHGSASLKTSPPGRKRVRAGIKLFDELQGRVSPENLNKKFTEIVNIPGMFQIFARLCC
jgi:hypothetical protein